MAAAHFAGRRPHESLAHHCGPMTNDQPPRSSARSLWLWVIVAFLVLMGAWAVLISIALKHRPQRIEIEAPGR